MKCSDAMTPNPKYCYPTDTVVRAAQIMREQDVGPVPVVDPNTRKLLGLVTDRDIALNVVAAGREPHAVEIQDIMSENLFTCNLEDDYAQAVESMAQHQVRRIPVVNRDGSLAGIISQADIARHSSDGELGQMVEDISEAAGQPVTRQRSERAVTDTLVDSASSLLVGAACFTLGAAAMYLMDPDRGRARRMKTRSKAVRLYNDSATFAGKVQRDVVNRTTGTLAGIKNKLHHQPTEVPEGKLVARIRSKMGHLISNPHAIQVSARDGGIMLTGDILQEEMPTLLSAVRSVAGVSSVDNRLTAHETTEGTPSLQGLRENREGQESVKHNWTPGVRALAGALGGCLAVYGLKTRGPAARTAGTLGLGLLARGISNTSVTNWIPLEGLRNIH